MSSMNAVTTHYHDIRDVVNHYHDIQARLKTWMDETLDPQLDKCNSVEDVQDLRWEIAQQFGGNAADHRLPTIVHVHFALHSSRFA